MSEENSDMYLQGALNDAKDQNEKKQEELFSRLDALTFEQQREMEKKTLVRFDKSGSNFSALYRQKGGYVITCWKKAFPHYHVRHGSERWVDANGRILRKRTFKDGYQVGTEQVFVFSSKAFSSPKLIYSCNFDDHGKKIGVERIYEYLKTDQEGCFKVGATMRTLQYANGLLHGKERRESVYSSRILSEREWVRGRLHGMSITYFGSGKEDMCCSYVAGSRNGQYIHKNRQGIAQKIITYSNGIKNGPQVIKKNGKSSEWIWECGVRVCPDTRMPYKWN